MLEEWIAAAHLPDVQLDLPTALLVALDNPHAAQDYLDHKPIFAEAERRAEWSIRFQAREELVTLGRGHPSVGFGIQGQEATP